MHFERKQKVWVSQGPRESGGSFVRGRMSGRSKVSFVRKRGLGGGKMLAGVAFLFLLGLCYQALFPVAPSNAATDSVEIELDVDPTLGMALDKTVLTMYDSSQCETGDTEDECIARGTLPSPSGTQVSADMNVYVTTNAASGYELKVYTLSPTNEMKHINTSVTADINPTAGQLSTLAANTWGVRLGAGNWMAVGVDEDNPTTINLNGEKSSAICNEILNRTGSYNDCVTQGKAQRNAVTFGANITDALPSGRYTNDVVFSVVAKTSSSRGLN